MKHIQDTKYNWNICGDLKVVDLPLGMRLGYTKYCRYICEWDSCAKESHYIKKNRPVRKNFVPGQKNVAHEPLVDPTKIFLASFSHKAGTDEKFRERDEHGR